MLVDSHGVIEVILVLAAFRAELMVWVEASAEFAVFQPHMQR